MYLFYKTFQGRNLSKNFGGILENGWLHSDIIWPLDLFEKKVCPEQFKNTKDELQQKEIEKVPLSLIFINFSGQDFLKGADGSRIVKEFLKKSIAIWFHLSKFEISDYNSEFYHGNRPIDLAQTFIKLKHKTSNEDLNTGT